MTDLYGKLGGGKSEHNRVIGKNTYKVRMGLVNPSELYLMPVDSKSRTGNPRFWNAHKAMLSSDPNHGPMTEQEQVDFFTSDELPESLKKLKKFHDRTRRNFERLKTGLEISGESQDDLLTTWDGGVAEGNNRTVIMQRNPERFKSARILCLPSNLLQSDLARHLSRRHVVPPARWESINQTAMLDFLTDVQDGVESDTITNLAAELGMDERKIKMLLSAGEMLENYQEKTGDYDPDKFSTFLKVSGNGKLRNMLYLKDGKPTEADGNGLGAYCEGLLERFHRWAQEGKINARSDVTNMTSKEVGLLMNKHSHLLAVIDEFGAGEATKRIQQAAAAKNRRQPGVKSLQAAIDEMTKVDGMTVEKLMENKEYVEQLADLQKQLSQTIERFTPKPRLSRPAQAL